MKTVSESVSWDELMLHPPGLELTVLRSRAKHLVPLSSHRSITFSLGLKSLSKPAAF